MLTCKINKHIKSTTKILFYSFIFTTIITLLGCAQTISNSKLNSESFEFANKLYESTNLYKYNIDFYYYPDTGNIEINDVIPVDFDKQVVSDFLLNNKQLLKDKNKVRDCITVTYDSSYSPKYDSCVFIEDSKSLSLFTKNDFSIGRAITGTIVSPLAILLTVLGEPTNPYKGTISLTQDKDAIKLFGKAVNSQVGLEVSNSCTLTDSKLQGWYKGSCIGGKATGFGIAVGADKYVGDFVNGASQGQGRYSWANGDRYEGEFFNNQPHGKGTFQWVTIGDSYTGDWINGHRNGYGKYSYKNGRYKEGVYIDDKLLDADIAADKDAVDFILKFKRKEVSTVLAAIELPTASAVNVYKFTKDIDLYNEILSKFRKQNTAQAFLDAFKISKSKSDIEYAFKLAKNRDERNNIELEALRSTDLEKDILDVVMKCDASNSKLEFTSDHKSLFIFDFDQKSSTSNFICKTEVKLKQNPLVPVMNSYKIKIDYKLFVTAEKYVGISRESTGSTIGDIFWGVVRAVSSKTTEHTFEMSKSVQYQLQKPKYSSGSTITFESIAVSSKMKGIGGFMEREVKLKGKTKGRFDIVEISPI